MTDHTVAIAGGGPAGMMLAAELALAGVDVAVLERRPDHLLVGSRAGGFHSRTIEVLDQRGVADRFLAEGQVAQVATFATTVLDMSDFPTRHPYSLGIWQNQIERIMADWIAELPVRVYYSSEALRRTTPASRSSCPTATRCGCGISSGATEAAASSVKPPASSSPDGTRPGAT